MFVANKLYLQYFLIRKRGLIRRTVIKVNQRWSGQSLVRTGEDQSQTNCHAWGVVADGWGVWSELEPKQEGGCTRLGRPTHRGAGGSLGDAIQGLCPAGAVNERLIPWVFLKFCCFFTGKGLPQGSTEVDCLMTEPC